ncbi:MAG: hypothetical protein KatS3mg122_0307 [Caldimonas sp.]|nr:MAG: hypothetical protein KatS3mg122_0307 [Caldimonas sp.]
MEAELLDRAAAAVRSDPFGPSAQSRSRPAVRLSGPANPVRPLLPAHPQAPHRAAAGLLHARGHGTGAALRPTARRAPSSSTKCFPASTSCRARPRCSTPARCRSQLSRVLPHHRARRPGGHLRGHQGERAARPSIAGGLGQRLDAACAPSAAYIKGTNGRAPGGRALPQGGQRHRRRRQPGRQAQGRRLRLPGDLAPRRRGVPRAAQEHRRRPPPHPRHEHGQLGARPVHEARDGERRLDALFPLRPARTCTTRSVKCLRGGLLPLRGHGRPRRDPAVQEGAGRPALAQDADSMLFETGHPWITFKDRVQRPLARSSTPASCTARNLCTEVTLNTYGRRDRRLQPRLGEPGRGTWHGRRPRFRTRSCRTNRPPPPCACSTTSSTSTTTPSRRPATPTCATARSAWASWASRTALHQPCASPTPRQAAVAFADRSMEAVSPTAPTGPRPSWPRSAAATPVISPARCGTAASCPWTRSMLLAAEERGGYVEVDTLRDARLGGAARAHPRPYGMRNSNCVAIAPTATISNIVGVDASIEPAFRQPVGQVQPLGRVHRGQ